MTQAQMIKQIKLDNAKMSKKNLLAEINQFEYHMTIPYWKKYMGPIAKMIYRHNCKLAKVKPKKF